jgi:hypothetical protein
MFETYLFSYFFLSFFLSLFCYFYLSFILSFFLSFCFYFNIFHIVPNFGIEYLIFLSVLSYLSYWSVCQHLEKVVSCLSFCLSLYLLLLQFASNCTKYWHWILNLSICLSVRLSVRPSVCPSVRLSVCMSIYFSFFLYFSILYCIKFWHSIFLLVGLFVFWSFLSFFYFNIFWVISNNLFRFPLSKLESWLFNNIFKKLFSGEVSLLCRNINNLKIGRINSPKNVFVVKK